MADKTASFALKAESDLAEVSAQDAAALEKLRVEMQRSQAAVKELRGAKRLLKGDTEEVVQATGALAAKIELEESVIAKNNVALLKLGFAYDTLAEHKKKLEKADLQKKIEGERKASVDAQREATGWLKILTGATLDSEARSKTASGAQALLSAKTKELSAAYTEAGGAIGLVATATIAATAAVAAFSAACAYGVIELAKFTLSAANHARALGLMREAMSGSAHNSEALASYIDDLRGKTDMSVDSLNAMGSAMARSFSGSMVGGKGIEDTFYAVSQAATAMGDEVGAQIKGIIERGKTWGRVGIGRFELQGTGLNLDDVANALSDGTKKGVADARAALVTGFVGVNAAAKALRKAVEDKFGAINAKKAFDLDVLVMRLKENFGALAKSVNLEPILRGFSSLIDLFGQGTVTGRAMGELMTDFGKAIGYAFEKGIPLAKKFIKGMVIGALDVEIAFLRLRKKFKETFGGNSLTNIDLARDAVIAGKVAVYALAGGLAVLAASVVAVSAPFIALYDTVTDVYDSIQLMDWSHMGANIVEGIGKGMVSATAELIEGVVGIADKVKGAFKDALGIHSPSTVFAGYGANTVAGFEQGVNKAAPRAQQAADGMAPKPASAPRGGSSGGRGVSVTVNINVKSGGSAKEIATAISAPDTMSELVRNIEAALLGAGIPTGGA